MYIDWNDLKLEVIFAPKTGSVKPWEIWAVFINRRVYWSSFKTEESANKKLNKLNKKYTKNYREHLNSLRTMVRD